jgi:hypothetical protein
MEKPLIAYQTVSTFCAERLKDCSLQCLDFMAWERQSMNRLRVRRMFGRMACEAEAELPGWRGLKNMQKRAYVRCMRKGMGSMGTRCGVRRSVTVLYSHFVAW